MVTTSVFADNGAFIPVTVNVSCEVDVIPVTLITDKLGDVHVPDVQLKLLGTVNDAGNVS
jgi:hypothetical protein